MTITVQKQVEETLEVKTPAYYKDFIGNCHHINEAGNIITVRERMISIWETADGKHHVEAVESAVRMGKECTKEDFDKAYFEVIAKFESATSVVF